MRAGWLIAACLCALAHDARAQTAEAPAPAPAPQPQPQPPSGFWLAQHDVLSIGTNEGSFTNASVGARIDYAATQVLRVGIEIAYANLEAEPDRAHSVLALLQFEARAPLGESWSVPARIAAGHLAENGLVLRVAAGVAFELASRLEVVLEVAPTFFSTRDGVYPAIGPGLELAFRL